MRWFLLGAGCAALIIGGVVVWRVRATETALDRALRSGAI